MSTQPITAGELRSDASAQGLLLDIDRFASHDGPGIRTTVFLKGCPLSCEWCHSPESRHSRPQILYQSERCSGCGLCVAACPQHALTEVAPDEPVQLERSRCDACGECVDLCYPGALRLAGSPVTVGELIADIERDRPFFERSGGGVTLSGGEPARQFTFAWNVLLACRERGIHTALETTGYARWQTVFDLASVADLLLYDIKCLDDDLHRTYTGVSNGIILKNLERLAEAGIDIRVRVPCIPGVNDGIGQIESVADHVAGLGLSRIDLLPYNAAAGAKYQWLDEPFALEDREPQSEAYMKRLADTCRRSGLTVQIGG